MKKQHGIKLSELLEDKAVIPDFKNILVSGISEYSGDVTHGDVFLAATTLLYCSEAINNGAIAIVYDDTLNISDLSIDSDVPVVACNKLSEHIAEIVTQFYGEIAGDTKTIAITGTDGKSSVAHMTTQAIENCGEMCGLIGTLGYGRLSALKEATHTTPPVSRIAKEYFQFKESGCKNVAIEASSHGIQQKRLSNVPIHTAVLTNITRDHLDYHSTVDEYINAKAGLFFAHKPKHAVINFDDSIGRQWCEKLSEVTNIVSFSLADKNADIYAIDVKYKSHGTDLTLSVRHQEIQIFVPLLGEFNVLNVLAVAAILVSLDKSNEKISQALNNLQAVPGRMQLVADHDRTRVIIDYAHTPAALFSAINAAREHCAGKLICVFGCGGDRDHGKRPLMGETASRYADCVVITSDNPRSENPQDIINDILSGCIKDHQVTSIVDRKEAIIYALKLGQVNDSILVAGKGHENYQEIAGQKFKFNDVDIVEQEFARQANG